MAQSRAFGYKMAWLAIRGMDPLEVVTGLGCLDSRPCPWAVGIEKVYGADPLSAEHPIFITPELDGWVLAASPAFFEEASDRFPERLEKFVTDLSSRLETEVQLFATHRVVEGHGWAKAEQGHLQRAFLYLGETGDVLIDALAKTPVEEELGLDFSRIRGGESVPDESMVMAVANAWSIDPTGIEEHFPDVQDGHLGKIISNTKEEVTSTEAPKRPWWKFW